MRKAKFAILISVLLIGGVVFVRVWANLKWKAEKEDGVPKISWGADTNMEKVRFVEEKHGRKTWELEAKSAQQYQDQNITVLDDVKVIFYSQDGRSFTISGDQGKVYQDSKDMELVGNVVLTSSDGYRLKTRSISYRDSEKKATTPDPVEIEGQEIRLIGRGMLVDMEAKTFKVLSDVKTQWRGGRKR